MKIFSARNLKFALYVIIVFIVILIGFNAYFTVQVHKKLAEVVSQPGKWPAGAYHYDQNIGFDFSSNISGPIQDGSFYVKSHELGFRIGEHEDASYYSPGGILALGCSFTYGDEVGSEHTFTQVIADSLSIDAYNYGVCSFSYIHALVKAQNLKEDGILDQLRPKYVILGCWTELLARSRTPSPPIASKNIPMVAAHIVKDENGTYIHPPSKMNVAFDLVNMYRKDGAGLSFKKFTKIFFLIPQYLPLYFSGGQKGKSKSSTAPVGRIPDLEVYDFYFTGVEEVFADYGSKIIVLFMPNSPRNPPDQALLDALALHPDIIFVNGLEANTRFEVPAEEYQAKHPQIPAHMAYGRETLRMIKNRE